MSSVVISGDTSGAITVAAPAVAGTNTITLPAVTGTVVVAGQNSAITAATAQTPTTATSVDFTSIPSWVKRITVLLRAVSTNGTSALLIRIGDSGGIVTSGYETGFINASGTVTANTAGFVIGIPATTADQMTAYATITNITGNAWVADVHMYRNSSTLGFFHSVGNLGLTGTLDRVRITTSNGTDQLDSGTINILYE